MKTSKSPLRVVRLAYEAARAALPDHRHKFSPKKFTQPQLLACLVLKEFLKVDYRGLAAHLADHPTLCGAIGLRAVPHYTTFRKAAVRLLAARPGRLMFDAVLERARRDGTRRRRVPLAAVDGTGLESRHVSRYFSKRRADGGPSAEPARSHFPKVVFVVDCGSHMILSAATGRGPGSDLVQFRRAFVRATGRARIGTLLADAGFDAEWVHEAVRSRGVRTIIPPTGGRPSDKPPTGRWRRVMKARFAALKRKYGQRWQVETVNSMIKRHLGSALRARTEAAQAREIVLRAITHNVMIARPRVFYRALHDKYRDDAGMVRRFVEEAQIGGQLQHPGIVPIYELGMFADRSPFFSMKLVKGSTLAKLLGARAEPSAELSRFLSIFEAVCQTVAYAHARGVIHRDLKPSNVMVGSFGEVQVMDWGLAKVLPRGGVVDDAAAGKTPPDTVIATDRVGDGAEGLSRPGSAMGTPSYMAPEQARGEIDHIDERSDVFALGSILCEILTGQPAFVGRSTGEILRKAALGDTADALARLSGCGVDADLIVLAKDCLAREREDRPVQAGAVAARIAAYLAGVQERMRRAELMGVEERARRRLTTVVAAGLLALTIAGGLGFTSWLQQRQAGAARVALAMKEATLLRDQAVANPDDPTRWPVALEGLKRAESALAVDDDPESRRRLDVLTTEVRTSAAAADRDRVLLDKLVDIRSAIASDPAVTIAAYFDAFRDAGVDPAVLTPAEVGARIKARPPAAALAMASALDDWASVRRDLPHDSPGADRLIQAARAADPDPWRDELRAALSESDRAKRKTALRKLADAANLDEKGPVGLDLLGKALGAAGDETKAESILRRAIQVHPGDVWLNFDLAIVLRYLHRADESIRFFTAARAIHPESAHELAHALDGRGDFEEAISVFRDLIRLRPDQGEHFGCLGSLLKKRGRSKEAAELYDEAVAASRKAIELRPGDATAYLDLSRWLRAQDKNDEAVAVCRKAIELQPDFAMAYYKLSLLLLAQGKREDALVALRKAIELQPDEVMFHRDLGAALYSQGKLEEALVEYRRATELHPEDPFLLYHLGMILHSQGKRDEAVAVYRKAIELRPVQVEPYRYLGDLLRLQNRLDEAAVVYRKATKIHPNLASVHYSLGSILHSQGKLDEAVAAYRKSIELNPDYAPALHGLGPVLHSLGKLDEAVASYRKSIELKPDAVAYYNLGNALYAQNKLDEAVTAFRKSIELNPDYAPAHNGLGSVLHSQGGKFDEAVAAYRKSIELKPDATTYYNLGNTLMLLRKSDEAVAACRKAIELQPDYAEVYYTLGLLHQGRGDFRESLAMHRKGHELGSKQPGWRYPSAQWITDAENLVAMADRLPAMLRNDDRPKDNPERLLFAQVCFDTKRYVASARFRSEAFAADPRLGDDRRAQWCYHAARSAAFAAAGQGKDEPPPDEEAKSKLRAQALGWLKAELAAWSKQVKAAPQAKQSVVPILRFWKADPDLASVRDPEPLAKLPEAERKAWLDLCGEVDSLLKSSQGQTP